MASDMCWRFVACSVCGRLCMVRPNVETTKCLGCVMRGDWKEWVSSYGDV